MSEEQAGRCAEPRKWAEPQIPAERRGYPASPLNRVKQGSSSVSGEPKKDPKIIASAPTGKEESVRSQGKGGCRGGKGCGGGSEGSAVARYGRTPVFWYSQAGLRSQVAAAAWGDVSMRLQIDGR